MGSPRPRDRSDFVEDVLLALKKRSKALKHKNARPQTARFIDIVDEERIERLEIDFVRLSKQSLTLIVWGDHMVEVRASEPNPDKGWKFQFAMFGRALGETDGRILIAAVEETLRAMFRLNQEGVGRLEGIWSSILAQGPKGV